MGVIYGLFDPRKPLFLWEVRYIGQTTVEDVRTRLRQHIYDAKQGLDRYTQRWIRSLINAGVRPHIQILEHCEVVQRHPREIAWIAEGRRQGWHLTNATDGGEGNYGFTASAETREKQRLAKLGKSQTEEAKRNSQEGMRKARLADPSIDVRRVESRVRTYKEHPEILVQISQNVKQYWIDHPDELATRSKRHNDLLKANPDILRRRNEAIKEGHAKQDKSPRFCEQCGNGPFKGPAGLNRHIAQTHRERALPPPTPTFCEICDGGPFRGEPGIAAHLRTAHPIDPNKRALIMCECGAGPFVGPRGLKRHQHDMH